MRNFKYMLLASIMGIVPAMAQVLPPSISAFSLPSENNSFNPDHNNGFSLESKIRECGLVTEAVARLACFDKAHVELFQYESNVAQNGYTWAFALEPPVMSLTAALVNSFNTQLSQTEKTSMVIICTPNLSGPSDYGFYFTFNDLVAKPTDNFINVKVTMDSNILAIWPMEISRSGKAIGFWRDVPALKDKLSSMVEIKNLNLDFKGPDDKTVHASFLLGNYREILEGKMKKACRF